MAENKNSPYMGPTPNSTGGAEQKQQELPGAGKKEAAKTTPDEGKTFTEDTVFVCVQDCFRKGVRYRRGEELTGKTCPPYFTVKPKAVTEDKNKK